jgi:hypothetical protein
MFDNNLFRMIDTQKWEDIRGSDRRIWNASRGIDQNFCIYPRMIVLFCTLRWDLDTPAPDMFE